MKISLLKFIDWHLGTLAIKLIPRHVSVLPHSPKSLLVIRPGGIGDAVLTLLLIQEVRTAYPEITIDVLAEKRNIPVFEFSSLINRLFCYDVPGDLFTVIRSSYDVVIDTEQWHRLSAVVSRVLQPLMSIGFATNDRSKMFSHPVAYSPNDDEINSFFRLLEPLHIPIPPSEHLPYLKIPRNIIPRVEDLLLHLKSKQFVAIFPGASVPEKRWGTSRFQKVADALYAVGIPVVVVGATDCIDDGKTIITGTTGLNLAGRLSLVESAAVLDRAALLLTGDSGLLHIAAGLGTPTVSLFGPSNHLKWAPSGTQHLLVKKELPCSPCSHFGYTPRCNHNYLCMNAITVDEVVTACMQVLRQGRSSN